MILWDSTRVWKILTAYVYTGAMVLGKSQRLISGKSVSRTVPKGQQYITEGTHEAIVSREEFEKAQLVINNRNKVVMGSVDFPLNFRKERNDWKLDLRVGEGADAIELEIFAEPNPPKRVNRPEACGLRHLAFRVEDVEATVAELEQMGIGCEPIRLDSYTQKKMTFFFDPDGLPLELHE